MESFEAKETALSIVIRAEIAGMCEDGEMMEHLRPVLLSFLREFGIDQRITDNGKRH